MDHAQMSSPCTAGTPGTASQSSVTCATSEWSIAELKPAEYLRNRCGIAVNSLTYARLAFAVFA